MINKTFPADHPYSSHLSRAALFPKFDSSEDPKRGVSARYEQPISDEMPATAADSLVIHKTKGMTIVWLIDSFSDWLTDWLIDWLID